ncbi:MAG: putative Ig domain-containing protein [Betaproteobacteria bacterium]
MNGTTAAIVAKLATLVTLLLSTAAGAQSATALVAAHSSKTHGSAGTFDLPIDIAQNIGGLITVEPRVIGNAHTIVFQFDGTITDAGGVTVTPTGAATSILLNNEIHVTLTGIADNQRVMISLHNVNGSLNPPPLAMGFLVGDVNSSRAVNASDIDAVKSRVGRAVNAANFRFDLTADGSIGTADRSAVKGNSGRVLPAISIAGAPAISGIPPAVGTVAVPYSFTFGMTGTSPIAWSVVAGSVPPGLTLDAGTGMLSGIPIAAGNYTFVVQAANVQGVALSPFTGNHGVIIAPAQPGGALVSLEGNVIPYPSKEPGRYGVFHAGLNGAGAQMNAWNVDPIRCNNPATPNGPPPTLPAITDAWHHNIDFDPYSAGFSNDFFDMAPNEVLSYRFMPVATLGQGTMTLTETTQGPFPANFMTLSARPCDFDVTKLVAGTNRDYCYKSATRENTIYFEVTNGAPLYVTYCKLIPGQVYYLNIRWQDGRIPAEGAGPATDSCADNGSPRCAGLIQIGR